MTERKACPGEKWEQLSTEELDRVLQAELRKEYPDENVVLPILRTLQLRETGEPVESSPDLQATTEQFSKHDTHTERNNHRSAWITGVAAIAAVACIVVMALPKKAGAESFLEVLYRWTSGIFEFIDPDNEESKPRIDENFSANNPGLYQLQDKLTEAAKDGDTATYLADGVHPAEAGAKLIASEWVKVFKNEIEK